MTLFALSEEAVTDCVSIGHRSGHWPGRRDIQFADFLTFSMWRMFPSEKEHFHSRSWQSLAWLPHRMLLIAVSHRDDVRLLVWALWSSLSVSPILLILLFGFSSSSGTFHIAFVTSTGRSYLNDCSLSRLPSNILLLWVNYPDLWLFYVPVMIKSQNCKHKVPYQWTCSKLLSQVLTVFLLLPCPL